MKNKIFGVFKKYRIALLSAVIALLVGMLSLIIITLFIKNSFVNKVSEAAYAFEYDTTWKLKEKKKDSIVLKHNSGSKITIQIIELSNEYRYATIDELIDALIYNIQKQNSDYKLISKKMNKLTKYEFNGYKLLYENGKEQVMINLYKKSNKLVSIRYEANNDYFDILLDSVHNIVYNLNVKDKKFNLKNNLKVDTSSITYSSNDELDKNFKENKTYEIASNNYYVQFMLPSNFVQSDFDSNLGLYHLKYDSEYIDITVNISKKNIYEYLDKEETINVYKNYAYYHKDGTKDYSDFKETLTRLESNYDSYIYKNSFYYNNAIKYDGNSKSEKYKRKDENAELIYALNKSHTLVIKIKTTGLPITEKLIDMIKIKKSINYASYVKIEKDGNFLISRLQRFTNYNKDKVELITLKVPDKYEEIDKNKNIYLVRNYGLNYHEDMLIYDYDIHYELSTLTDDKIVDTINKNIITAYGEYHNLDYSGNLMINGKKFKVYDGGYTDISGIMFTNINRKRYYVNKKVLFYEMPDKGNFYIEINGNSKEITNAILNEILNFTIEEKDY